MAGNVLHEALRRAGNQREFDVVPILTDGVIDNSPAL